jgi:hypothetical protein
METKSRALTTKRRAVLVMAILAPLGAGGCKDDHPVVSHSSVRGLDRPAASACDLFAGRYRRAGTTVDRLRLADEVGRYAGRSDNGAVSGRAGAVGRSANRGDQAWAAASAQLLRACRDAGWRP